MISIPKYYGEFGNRLFQYCFARILSERFNQGYDLAPINEIELDLKKDEHRDNVKGSIVIRDDNMAELNNGPDVGYHLWGFFQDIRLFENWKEKIKEWILHPRPPVFTLPVVHIRRGDYFEAGSVIGLQYYVDILKTIKRRPYVIGRGIDQETKRALDRFKPIYSNSKPIDDFYALLGADTIVMSNSTFAWWGAWLSDAKKIYYPVPDSGYFSKDAGHMHLEPGESRYEFIRGVCVEKHRK